MAQADAGGAGGNELVPQVDGAAVGDGAVPAKMDGARAQVAQVAAPVAGPPVAPVAVALFPQGVVAARFDVDAALLGPVPRKSNGSCEILPNIADATGW